MFLSLVLYGVLSELCVFFCIGRVYACRLVSLLEDNTSTVELVYEVVVTLGSFAHGTTDNVSVILSTRAVSLLINGTSVTIRYMDPRALFVV